MNLTIYLYFLAAFLCAMGVGGVLFPRIILISKRKRILDRPNGRKVHVSKIPRLGGFAFLSRDIGLLLGDERSVFHV